MTRRLMGTREVRLYLLREHGIYRTQGCVCNWMRRGYILPISSWRDAGGRFFRQTTRKQVDAAVRYGRVPRDNGANLSRLDRRDEVAVQLMDELGLTLVEGE